MLLEQREPKPDRDGLTLLHKAAIFYKFSRDSKIANYLVRYIDPSQYDHFRRTAYSLSGNRLESLKPD